LLWTKSYGTIQEGPDLLQIFSQLDNTIIAFENLCALKIKYIEVFEGETRTENKVIAIYKLQESSSGEVMVKVLKQKLFLIKK